MKAVIAKPFQWWGSSGSRQGLAADRSQRHSQWGFAEVFIISQTALPAMLYLPGAQSFRLPLRIAAFGISLSALVWVYHKHRKRVAGHPAATWLILAAIWLGVMILHPTTNSVTAGIAQTFLYVSVMAPLFWAPMMIDDPQRLGRILALLLICNGINSLVGVLQVYYPDAWMPVEFSRELLSHEHGVEESLGYRNDAGRLIIRPPGLFDNPGAVCGAGMIAAFLGIAFFLSPIRLWQRFGSLGFAVLGVMAIFLSQVRTSLLLLGGMVLVYALTLGVAQRSWLKAVNILLLAAAVGFAGYLYSSFTAGQAITDRFGSLAGDDPVAVYQDSERGSMLMDGLTTLLPTYPLGAGLGRWGLMRDYFGNEGNLSSPQIWAEVQIPALILDGGGLLLLFYGLALGATTVSELRIARSAKSSSLRRYAPIIAAVNIGVVAITFSFTPFTTQLGMQYWFLAGILHGAAQLEKGSAA